jgi:hypothetical protein
MATVGNYRAVTRKYAIGSSTRQPDETSPTTAVWREQALVDIAGAQMLADRFRASRTEREPETPECVFDGIDASLTAARDAANGASPHLGHRLLAGWRGAGVERAWGQLDAAEEELLRIGPEPYVRGQMPRLLARSRRALNAEDPRRMELEEIACRLTKGNPTPVDREVLGAVLHATNCEARRKQTRVRSFRNVLIVTSIVLWLAVAGLAVLGSSHPQLIPLCFNPTGHVVCPTQESPAPVPQAGGAPGQPAAADTQVQEDVDIITRATVSPWDIFLVEIVGLLAAAVAAAAALRGIRGTSTPYSVPVALAVLKLPTGALTAVLGLMLMRGQFVPGLTALDFPAQIIAWAVIFGYAQQLFTRLVDARAQDVLDGALPAPDAAPSRPAGVGAMQPA